MPSRISAKAAQEQQHANRVHLWNKLGVFIALAGLLVALPPAYWGYACRYHGTLCEGSPYVGASHSAIEDNIAKLQSESIKENNQLKLVGFKVETQTGWFARNTTDVLAIYNQNKQILIDKLTGVVFPILQQEKDNILIIKTSRFWTDFSTHENQVESLNLYAGGSSFRKRVYDFSRLLKKFGL